MVCFTRVPGSQKGLHWVSVKVCVCCSKIGLPSTRLPLNSNNKQNRVRIGWRIVPFVMDGWKQRRFHPERSAAVQADKTRECPAGGSKSSRETLRSLQQEKYMKRRPCIFRFTWTTWLSLADLDLYLPFTILSTTINVNIDYIQTIEYNL